MKTLFSTLILIIGLALTANSQTTFSTNVLRVCEFDTAVKGNLKNCSYYKEKTEFVLSDSVVTITYTDSVGDKKIETYKVNEVKNSTGLTQYFCSIANTNVIIYYYEPLNLIKTYYYNHKDRKTYVYYYLK